MEILSDHVVCRSRNAQTVRYDNFMLKLTMEMMVRFEFGFLIYNYNFILYCYVKF